MCLLLILSGLIASLNSVSLNRANVSEKSIFKFNLICSLVWLIILFSLNGFKLRFTKETMIFGLIYGITQILFILFKTLAMSTSPVSIKTLIGTTSLLISLLVSLVPWGEEIGFFDNLGVIVLGAGIFLTNYRKSNCEARSPPMWKYYSLIFLVLASGVGITFKCFGKYGNLDYSSDMPAFASMIMTLFLS